jgi:hypothetical protein
VFKKNTLSIRKDLTEKVFSPESAHAEITQRMASRPKKMAARAKPRAKEAQAAGGKDIVNRRGTSRSE